MPLKHRRTYTIHLIVLRHAPSNPPTSCSPQLLAIPIRAYLKSVVGNIYFCIVLLTHLIYEFPMAEMIEACFLLRTEQWKRNTTLTCIYWSRNWRNEISDRSGKHGLFVSIFRLGLVYYYYYCCYYYYCYYIISFQGTFCHMMQKDRRKSNLNLIFQIDAQKCIKRIKKKKERNPNVFDDCYAICCDVRKEMSIQWEAAVAKKMLSRIS